MKILVGIPCLYNGATCLKAFRSVVLESDVLCIDNGGDQSVKQAIRQVWHEYPNVKIIQNQENIFVNAAWSQIIKYFLDSNYDQLVIMNSDLIMSPGWSKHLEDGVSCLVTDGSHKEDTEVNGGNPGVFINLNKAMATLVYPLPTSIRLWYGDELIFRTLRKHGYKTIIKAGLIAEHYHNGSQTIGKLPGKSEMIEEDKIAWLEIEKTL